MGMGVNFTPIITKKVVSLSALSGTTLAVDANNVLYQFLALIRTRSGRSLTDSRGNVTSHLIGLASRATRLLSDHHLRLVYVFDGTPPQLKQAEIEKRREVKKKAWEEWKEALEKEDYATAYSKSTMTSSLTNEMVEEAKQLLTYLGIPYVQAPSEAEVQAAYMTKDVYAAASRDYDTLLFGANRQVRYVTIQGKEHLPSSGRFRKYEPEVIDLQQFLDHHGITREQLVELSILIGNDFTQGISGIGPKTGLKLLKSHGHLEDLPSEIRENLPDTYSAIKEIFLHPKVTDEYTLEYTQYCEDELVAFLRVRDFSDTSIERITTRMRRLHGTSSLDRWIS